MAQNHDEDEDIVDDKDVEDTDVDTTDGDDEEDDSTDDKDPDALKDEDIDKDNDPKSLREKLKKERDARVKADNARRQLTARAKKAEARKGTASPDTTKNNQGRKTAPAPLEKRISNIEMIEQKRQFGYENGLSPEETDLAFKFANGKPSKKVLSDPFFKAGLEGIRAAKKTAANTPGSSRRSSSFSSKPFADQKKDERKEVFNKRMQSIRQNG